MTGSHAADPERRPSSVAENYAQAIYGLIGV
jgi:hypothetical protein